MIIYYLNYEERSKIFPVICLNFSYNSFLMGLFPYSHSDYDKADKKATIPMHI